MEQFVETEWCGATLRISTGKLAQQANGSVLLSNGDTIILATATMSKEPKSNLDFFPLTCDYEERKYAVGKIPGGFVKRGGRPGEKATLTSRLIDRPLRPLFPYGMRNETQVIAMPLSYQPEFSPRRAFRHGGIGGPDGFRHPVQRPYRLRPGRIGR